MCRISTPTCFLPAWRGTAPSLVSEVEDFAGSAAGFGASSEVGKREPLVLCKGGEVEILGAEEEQRVEQHYGGVSTQLLTLPQVGLHNTRWHNTTLRRREEAGRESLLWLKLLTKHLIIVSTQPRLN